MKRPGQNSVVFAAPLAPVNRWRIRIPESGVNVNVQPMLAATEVPETNASAAETVVLAFVGAAPQVRIQWTPKAGGAQGLEALVSVLSEQQFVVAEGVARTNIRLDYTISRAELRELAIQVPADQKVVSVVDANVREWRVTEEGDTQRVSIQLFEPAREQQSVELELEKFVSETATELTAPTVRAVDVGRQRGVIVVRVADGLRGEAIDTQGLSQLDASDVPQGLREHPHQFAFRYASVPYQLSLGIQKIKPRIHVDQLVEVYLEPQKLTLDLFARYAIERAGVFELQLELPGGYELLNVEGQEHDNIRAADVDSHTVEQAADGRHLLKVNLASKAAGLTGLHVQLQRRLDNPHLVSPTGIAARLDLDLPRVVSSEIERTLGRVVIHAPESLRLVVDQPLGLRTITFQEAFQSLPSIRNERFPGLRPVQAFAFGEEQVAAELVAQRRQPQVTVRQLLVTRIDPGVVKYAATFFFDIRYSGVNQLRIDLPQQVAARVRNETKTLRETTITPPPADVAADYVAWQFSGETELLGSVECQLTWEVPVEELAIGSSVDFEVPRLIPHGVDRADGQIVLVKAETIDVQPEGSPHGLDPIDPQHDLMKRTAIADAAAAMEFHDEWQLTLRATRYELEEIKHTSIERGLLRMVLTRSDRVSVQALYRMRSSRQRLQIQLPQGVAGEGISFDTDPLRINGRRIPLERGDSDTTYFVPLVGMTPDTPFILELRYTTSADGSRLDYPTFPDEPAVQKVDLVAYLPESQTYLGMRGPWNDEMAARRKLLFGSTTAQLSASSSSEVAARLAQLVQGIEAPIDSSDFPVAGRPLLFSTLRPPPPATGALRLTTVSTQLLRLLTFGLIALPGLLLLRRPPFDRWMAALGLVTLLVLSGVFLPTLASAIFTDIAFLLAVALVGMLWMTLFFARTLPHWWADRKQRLATPAPPLASQQGGASHA